MLQKSKHFVIFPVLKNYISNKPLPIFFTHPSPFKNVEKTRAIDMIQKYIIENVVDTIYVSENKIFKILHR